MSEEIGTYYLLIYHPSSFRPIILGQPKRVKPEALRKLVWDFLSVPDFLTSMRNFIYFCLTLWEVSNILRVWGYVVTENISLLQLILSELFTVLLFIFKELSLYFRWKISGVVSEITGLNLDDTCPSGFDLGPFEAFLIFSQFYSLDHEYLGLK